MTAIPQPRPLADASDRITKPLRAVAARRWKIAAAAAALRSLCVGLAVVLAAALFLGNLPGLPGWLRAVVAAVAWATTLAGAAHFLRPLLRRRSLADAAFAVERRVPGLHERLSSAVELAAEPDAFAGSPLLVRHLLRQAESDAAAVNAEHVVPTRALKRSALFLSPVVLLWVAAAVLAPRPLLAGLYRVLMPWRDHLPAVLTTIAVAPGDVTLAEGDTLEIKATVNAAAGPDDNTARALLLTRAADADRPVSRDLDRAAPRQFKLSLPDLRQSFSYRVSAGAGESRWFTATVLPRPAVARLDLRYDYPAYTGLDPKVHPAADGAITALQGTEVTLTVDAAGPLDLADGKSRVAITEGPRHRDAPFKPVEGRPDAYEARLTVFNSGSYRIHLVNRHGLANRDDQPRPIVAAFDAPPKVTITAPESEVAVRADDDVPVSFAASDDFGVAALQAMVQVDAKPAEPVDVSIPRGADRRRLEGAWALVVPAHLARAGVTEAKQITYWLRATDNRDPDPQSIESAKQTLRIDNGQPLAYRTRVEQQHAKDLLRAIDRAIERLNQSEGAVNSLKDIDRNRAMNPDEKTRGKEQREHLAKTSEELGEAAESNLRNAFNAVAAAAKEIADTPIRGAAENVARSLLSADEAEPRRRAATEAVAQVTDARKQLEALKKKVEARSKELQAARELEKLAQKQAELARAQPPRADQPESAEQKKQREKTQQRQRELAERLQRAVGDSEALRDPKATEQAIRLRELLDRVEQIQKDQAPLKGQFAKQEETARLHEQALTLAARQEELNDAIRRFAGGQRSPLQRADAHAPDAQHQAGIIDRLRQNETQQAHDMQRQSTDRLKEATKRLQERGRSRDLKPNAVEQYAIQQREQAKQLADQAGNRAKEAAEQFRQARESKDAGREAEARKALDESAQALTDQARAAAEAAREPAASGDPTAEKNAAQARAAADASQAAVEAARQAAQQGDAAQASKKLEEAGRQLAKAQAEALDATRADLVADQQSASKAAGERAKELADQQAELAEATKETAKALEQARRDQQSPQDVANRQNQLKDQTRQALQQADQLEQLAKSTNASLARRAEVAEKLLEEAASAEAKAAESEHAVAKAGEQASGAARQSAEANQQSAQFEQQAAGAADQAAGHQQHADANLRQAADARARKDEGAAKALANNAADAKRRADEQQKQVEKLGQQSAAADQRAADATKNAEAARQIAATARKQAAEQQARAGEALARAEDALRDIDRMSADASGRPETSAPKPAPSSDASQPDAEAQANARADAADAPPPNESAAKSGEGPPPPPLTPEQAMRAAAQGAQEAVQAQQQAMNNNADPGAIQQAAAALQQAASAMSAATASSESSDSALAGADEQAEQGTDAQGAKAAAAAAASSQTLDSRTGTGTGGGTHDGRPQSVQELGISAGDWARLGPLTRQELLNAAQQSGPPAYREMIKNYYVKIAKLGRDLK